MAFPAPGSGANGPLVGYMVDYFKLTYPVGYANKNEPDQYLSRAQSEVFMIPLGVHHRPRGNDTSPDRRP